MSGPSNQPPRDKPYDFIPIAKPRREKTVGHESIRGAGFNTGVLAFQLKTLSYLFVAGGSYILSENREAPVARDFYRVNSRPAIPGSTLKGAVRSVAEAISPSCVTITRLDLSRVPYAPKTPEEGCQPDYACPACSMFGRLNRMSKIVFNNAILARGELQLYRLPALFSPRASQAGQRYQENNRYKGRKFYFHGRPFQDGRQPPVEALPPDSLLRGEIRFENLTDAELGLLILALGLDTSFVLKLGGGKPACLGSIQVQPGELQLITPASFLRAEPDTAPLMGEAMVEVMLEKVRAAYQNKLILNDRLEKLREIWRYPNNRDCPTGAY